MKNSLFAVFWHNLLKKSLFGDPHYLQNLYGKALLLNTLNLRANISGQISRNIVYIYIFIYIHIFVMFQLELIFIPIPWISG